MPLNDIILTSEENYETLVNGGSVTKEGETFTYDENSVYAVETESLEVGTLLEIVDNKLMVSVPTADGDYKLHIADGVATWVAI